MEQPKSSCRDPSVSRSPAERLLAIIPELSLARDLASVTGIVRRVARELTGADGATFVLRDGEHCYYADEDAIAPLWKGKRFPMKACISGWVMQTRKPAVIEDIYQDDRIPREAYRSTFVRSLAMVPIRQEHPIGAIGAYWAQSHRPAAEELVLLQMLADCTSTALANVALYRELQAKVVALQRSNYELSQFAWVASHDLAEPLRMVRCSAEMLHASLPCELAQKNAQLLSFIADGAERLQNLVASLLAHARLDCQYSPTEIDTREVLRIVSQTLRFAISESKAEIFADDLPRVWADPAQMVILFQNLLSNALKFRDAGRRLRIDVQAMPGDGCVLFTVKDNGIGIEPQYQEGIFDYFQRLHPQDRYPGAGLGLSTCRKIVELHGGHIWVESEPGVGSSFSFSLGHQPAHAAQPATEA